MSNAKKSEESMAAAAVAEKESHTTTQPLEGTATTLPTPQAPVAQTATDSPKAGTALAVVDFGADAGAGMENVTSEERTLPFVRMIQKGSPQVDDTHANYQQKKIEDAKPGMLLKTNTNEALDVTVRTVRVGKKMEFIAAHRDRNYVERWPQAEKGQPVPAGQGFVGLRDKNDPLVLKLLAEQGGYKKLVTPEGTNLIDTWYLYGLFIYDLGLGADMPPYVFPGVLPFASTQIPYYKGFMDIQTNIKYPDGKGGVTNPPLWAHRWTLGTFPDSNKKSRDVGGGFYSFDLKLANGASPANPRPALMKMDDPLYIMARELYQAIKAGKAKADYAGDADTEGTQGEKVLDKDIPF